MARARARSTKYPSPKLSHRLSPSSCIISGRFTVHLYILYIYSIYLPNDQCYTDQIVPIGSDHLTNSSCRNKRGEETRIDIMFYLWNIHQLWLTKYYKANLCKIYYVRCAQGLSKKEEILIPSKVEKKYKKNMCLHKKPHCISKLNHPRCFQSFIWRFWHLWVVRWPPHRHCAFACTFLGAPK